MPYWIDAAQIEVISTWLLVLFSIFGLETLFVVKEFPIA